MTASKEVATAGGCRCCLGTLVRAGRPTHESSAAAGRADPAARRAGARVGVGGVARPVRRALQVWEGRAESGRPNSAGREPGDADAAGRGPSCTSPEVTVEIPGDRRHVAPGRLALLLRPRDHRPTRRHRAHAGSLHMLEEGLFDGFAPAAARVRAGAAAELRAAAVGARRTSTCSTARAAARPPRPRRAGHGRRPDLRRRPLQGPAGPAAPALPRRRPDLRRRREPLHMLVVEEAAVASHRRRRATAEFPDPSSTCRSTRC